MERIKAKVDKSKVDFFIATNAGKFDASALMGIRDTLERMDEDQFMIIQATDFRDPTMILLIAVFLGWERFFLDDVGMGILKIITCYGFCIWGIIDMFTAIDRAKKYNYNKFMQVTSYMR